MGCKWRTVGRVVQSVSVTLKKLLISHPQAGTEIFKSRGLERGMLFAIIKGSWYTRMYWASNLYKHVWRDVHGGNESEVWKRYETDFGSSKGPGAEKHPVWMVHVQFFAMQVMNDWQYNPGDPVPQLEQVHQTQENNMVAHQMQWPERASDLTSSYILATRSK